MLIFNKNQGEDDTYRFNLVIQCHVGVSFVKPTVATLAMGLSIVFFICKHGTNKSDGHPRGSKYVYHQSTPSDYRIGQ